MLLQEEQKNKKAKNKMVKRPKNPFKNSVLRWLSQNGKIIKMDSQQKLADTMCVRKGEKRTFSCTPSVLAQNIFLVQNSQNQEKL